MSGMTPAQQGVTIMNVNLSSLQNQAMSLIGALLASALFVSAAVGPAGQLI